jgi:Phosphatidylinositol-4-phosphate 5-Kinase
MLEKMNIMDYSLLLGIERLQDNAHKRRSENRKSRIVSDLSQDRRATYNMMDAAGMKRH